MKPSDAKDQINCVGSVRRAAHYQHNAARAPKILWGVWKHRAYSPNFAPSDFHLIPALKQQTSMVLASYVTMT